MVVFYVGFSGNEHAYSGRDSLQKDFSDISGLPTDSVVMAKARGNMGGKKYFANVTELFSFLNGHSSATGDHVEIKDFPRRKRIEEIRNINSRLLELMNQNLS